MVAALVMALVLALLRLWLEIPSPPELVGDRVGERVPAKPFLSLIGRIGSYGRLKALSVFGVIFATLVLGAIVGAIYARVTEHQRVAGGPTVGRFGLSWRAMALLSTIVGLAWVASVAAFWPLLASYYRGAPRGTARLANAAALLVAYVVFAVAVVVVHRLLVHPPVVASAGPTVGRRRVLVAGGAGLGLAVATGGCCNGCTSGRRSATTASSTTAISSPSPRTTASTS